MKAGSIAWTFDTSFGCLGSLTPGSEAYIRDVNTGNKLGPYQDGEICVKSLTTMKGYLNNSEANDEVFDEEGFVHMGDFGFYDQEGKLHFKERIKEVIRVNSRWFGPSEVEDTIENINGVLEACVWVNILLIEVKWCSLVTITKYFRVHMMLVLEMIEFMLQWLSNLA